MNKKLLLAAASLALLGAAGQASALTILSDSGNYLLDSTTFGSGEGVHWNDTNDDVMTALAIVNQDDSEVQISSEGDTFDTNGNGEAAIEANNGMLSALVLDFEHTWGALSFTFNGSQQNPSTFAITVNGVAQTFTGCSFCTIGNNAGFSIYAQNQVSAIDTIRFDFEPDIDGARQFRLLAVDDNNNPNVVPEPATWAMMILGFGAVGSLMRRRRQGFARA